MKCMYRARSTPKSTSHHITSHHITSHHITHTHTQSKRGRKIAHTYMTHISMYMHTYRCLSSSISSMFMTANHFLTILLCSQLQFIMLHASNQEKVLIYRAHFKPYCVVCAFLEFVHCSATFVCVCVWVSECVCVCARACACACAFASDTYHVKTHCIETCSFKTYCTEACSLGCTGLYMQDPW